MKIIQKEGAEPIPAEVIAQSIAKIGDAAQRLMGSGLTRKAILILLANASGVPKVTCSKVLDGLNSLKRLYLEPKKGKP
jgi:hypothetical protein